MAEEPKKLYRSRDERMIAGVCGGLGDYFNVDPTLIRLLFALLALFGFGGIIVYLFMMIIVPEEPLNADENAIVEQATEEPGE